MDERETRMYITFVSLKLFYVREAYSGYFSLGTTQGARNREQPSTQMPVPYFYWHESGSQIKNTSKNPSRHQEKSV
jgi:hypothetical protein